MEWMLMPLKRYADFSGRSRRMEFWMWQVAKFLASMVIWIVFFALAGTAMMTAGSDPERLMAAGGAAFVLVAMVSILGLAIVIPDLAVTVRRLHDTDRRGWWILAPLVPYLFFWVTFAGIASSGATPEELMTGPAAMIGLVCLLAAMALALVLLVFYFIDGTPGPNRFGTDPKGRGAGVFS